MNEAFQNDRIDPDLEARIVALVLGEASELERDQLNRLIEQRPELAAVKKQFESIDGLMRDVSSDEAPPEDEDWKLPAERRHKVLAAISGQTNRPGGVSALRRNNRFWNVSRVAISFCVAGLFLLLASGSYFLLSASRSLRVGQAASDSRAHFSADMELGEAEWEEYAMEGASQADDYVVSGSERRFRGGQLARPAKPAEPRSGSAFGDTADSNASLSAIRDSLGVDAIKEQAGRPSAYYLQDDVQYFPAVPSTALPEVAVADESGVEKGQTFRSTDKWNQADASRQFSTGAMPRFDNGVELSDQITMVDPQASTSFGRSVTDFESVQRGEAKQRAVERYGMADGKLGFQSGAGGAMGDAIGGAMGDAMGGGGFGGGIGGEAFGAYASPQQGVSPQQGLAESSDGAMAGMDMMEGMDMMGDASVSPADRPTGDLFYDTSPLSSSLAVPQSTVPQSTAPKDAAPKNAAPQSEPAVAERELEELFEHAPTESANNEFAEQPLAATPRIIIPQEEESVWLGTRVAGRRSRAEIAGKTATLSKSQPEESQPEQSQPDPSKPTTNWGVQVNRDKLRELGVSLDGGDGLAAADQAEKQSNRQKGLQQQNGRVASKGRDGFMSYESTESSVSRLLKRSTMEKSPVPAGLDEKDAATEAFSTFSLHVSDVSFKLAAAALARGEWPEPAKIRIEEFVNALDYGDPMPSQDEKVACRLEQAIHPFLQQRNLLRVSMRTAAAGRASNTPLRLTFLLDNSGSMERIDRQQTVRSAFALLARQLKPLDQVTLISFARQPRLLADKVDGSQAQRLVELIDNLPSEGGTNIEAALQLAFEKAREHQTAGAQNRIILLTDGAVNLGDANPDSLSQRITTIREAGIAFDAAGIVAEGLNDEVLEALTRKGDGRYYLLDSPDDADDGFARQIAGALRPSAKNVKVQIEFNPKRVGHYKLLGFEKHLLKKEDFRNDKVDAAEMAAAEAGVAVYQFQAKPDGEGDVGSVSVRFQDLSTGRMIENRWPIPYQPDAPRPDQASESIRIATAAALFAAKLRGEPLGANVDLKTLADLLAGLPDQDRNRKRVQQLQMMIGQARQLVGN
ncbi:von Willebrand factor [Stieleria neptunia]|uniref:von Willebrand factor n=1 Tax=Stieleria neptunia TaxID=2527979 RepID=A0A518I3C1_9BACT|nr:von Willebrand factor type A domain-containing protein [Stieleria neptunia]QDV47601.1 von Willebrand factor [Stieleria neptunia]